MTWWTAFGDENHVNQLEALAATNGTVGWTCAKGLRFADRIIFYLKRPAQRFVAQGVALEDPLPPTGANDGSWEATHWTVLIGNIRMLPNRRTRQEMMRLLPEWKWLRAPHREARVPDQLVGRVLAALCGDANDEPKGYEELWLPEVIPSRLNAPEGLLRWRTHLMRERNSRLTADKKRLVLAAKGRLVCDVCAFDFGDVYGVQCKNFCEVHHTKPLSSIQEVCETSIDDLVILCSNCHRAIHRIDPMPNIEELRTVIFGQRELRGQNSRRSRKHNRASNSD